MARCRNGAQELYGGLTGQRLVEDIRQGMEGLNHRNNQRRTSTIKFLGEMYNYRLVDSALIFKVLYSLITFGVILDPEAALVSLDPPEHMVRLRLVCVLLGTSLNDPASPQKPVSL